MARLQWIVNTVLHVLPAGRSRERERHVLYVEFALITIIGVFLVLFHVSFVMKIVKASDSASVIHAVVIVATIIMFIVSAHH